MTVMGWELDGRSIVAGLSLIFAFVVQAGLGLIWLTHLQDDVGDLKHSVIELKIEDHSLNERIHQLDIDGTRGLAIVKERQEEVFRRLGELEHGRRPPEAGPH